MLTPARLALTLLVSAGALLSGCRVRQQPEANPCEPNPCTTDNRTTCVIDGGEARCVCGDGFVTRPNGACEPVSALNCPEHSGDSFEPDDCTASAKEFDPGAAAQSHTIEPAGDYDFFTFTAAGGHVYQVGVNAEGTLYPRLDLFDASGTWSTWAEQYRSGTAVEVQQPRLFFKNQDNTPSRFFVRVMHSPVDPSPATGAYLVDIEDLGFDDHGDQRSTSTSVSATLVDEPPVVTAGRFEYPDDQDWFRFQATTTMEYLLLFDGTLDVPDVALYSTATQPRFTQRSTEVIFTVPADGTWYLQIYDSARRGGSYRFTLQRQTK